MTCTCYEGLVGTCLQYVEKNPSLNIGLFLSIGFLTGMVVTRLLDLWADGYSKKGKK